MVKRTELIRLAVFGKPVTRSLSPLIHQHFARQFDLDIDYRAIECDADDFEPTLKQFIATGARGCNVTAPHKRAAWQFATHTSPLANRAQAANTLLFEPSGQCHADSTDGRGLLRDVRNHFSSALTNTRILILGAGGATAGILSELLSQSPAEIVIANRTYERASKLVQRFADQGPLSACRLDATLYRDPFDLIINASSQGHQGSHIDIPSAALSPSGLLYDLNYGQAAIPLRHWCQSQEIAYQDGLGMLVAQAALSFTIWTEYQPDIDPVLRKLRQDLTINQPL